MQTQDKNSDRRRAKSGLQAFLGGAAAALFALIAVGTAGLISNTGFWGRMSHMGAVIGKEGMILLVAVWVAAVGLLALPEKPCGGLGRSLAVPLRGLINVVHEGILFILGWAAFLGFFASGLSHWVETRNPRAIDTCALAAFITVFAMAMIFLVPKIFNEVGSLFSGWRSRATWAAGAFIVAVLLLAFFLPAPG